MSSTEREDFEVVGEVDIDQLVELAKISIVLSGDQKSYVQRSEMLQLYKEPGAEIMTVRSQMGGDYVIEVRYCGVIFVHVTSRPFLFRRDVYEHYLDLGSTSIH